MRISRTFGLPEFALLAVVTLLTIALFAARKYNLDFHTRDYQYYLQVFDDALKIFTGEPRSMLLHPDGANVLGFSGIDGFPHSGITVHFSPITYLLGAVYRLGGEILLIAVYAVVLGYAFLVTAKTFVDADRERLLTVLLLSSTIPCLIVFTTEDFRVYALLVSTVLLLFRAIEDEAPAAAIFSLVAVMFLIREESYFFSIIGACHLLAKGRMRLAFQLVALCVLYVIFLYAFFWLVTDLAFGLRARTVGYLFVPLAIFAVCAAGYSGRLRAIGGLERVHARYRALVASRLNEGDARYLSLFIWLNVYLAPIWVRGLGNLRISSLFGRYFVLLFVFVIGVSLAVRFFPAARNLRYAAMAAGIVVASLGLGRIAVDIAGFDWARNALIWELAGKEAGKDDLIVTNYEFHQAFWNHNAVVWQRLPATAIDDDGRFWPRNRDRLAEYVKNADLFLVSAAEAELISGLGVRRLNCRPLSTATLCE